MFMKAYALALALLSPGASGQGVADAPSRDAAAILSEMKAACGGDAWDRVQGWHETGSVDLPGRPGVPYEIWHDMRTLKTAIINRVDGRIVRRLGFNGSAHWQVGPDGRVAIDRDPATVRRHRRDAYLSSFGWFFPRRFPAAITLAEPQSLNGTTFDVLRVTPEAADGFDLWVDRETHRVRRIAAGSEYADLADYRVFDGVCSATTGRQGDGDPSHEIVLHVQNVETTSTIAAVTFEPPAQAADR